LKELFVGLGLLRQLLCVEKLYTTQRQIGYFRARMVRRMVRARTPIRLTHFSSVLPK